MTGEEGEGRFNAQLAFENFDITDQCHPPARRPPQKNPSNETEQEDADEKETCRLNFQTATWPEPRGVPAADESVRRQIGESGKQTFRLSPRSAVKCDVRVCLNAVADAFTGKAFLNPDRRPR